MTANVQDWTTGAPLLLVWQCEACGQATALPHVGCAACGGRSVATRRVEPAGTCVARTVLHPRDTDPVVLVLASLDEGAVVMARADEDVVVGDSVRARFERDGSEALVPVFARTAAQGRSSS